jgi:serine/threonine protein kinase/WD40 repeat protein
MSAVHPDAKLLFALATGRLNGAASGPNAPRPAAAVRGGDEPTVELEGNLDETIAPGEHLAVQERLPFHGGKRFGDYEIIEEIAHGGMGVVYRARQTKLNRIVALKMILAGRLASPSDIQRFYAEAEAAAQLEHPGIVPIHEVGQYHGQHFFSMGFVDGQSLADRLQSGPLVPHEAARLVQLIATAIAFAHEHGVIHRDLKPANVLLDKSGMPKVSDFGLAKKLESSSGLTYTGAVLGTPSYMPPEQASGATELVGPPADVYSLGAILYSLLTGRPPFQAASVVDTLLQVLGNEPVAPRHLNPKIPRDVEIICLKCLQKTIANRYHSARELADDLGRFLDGRPIQARPVGRPERIWRWSKKNPAVAALGLMSSLALFLSLLGWQLWQTSHARKIQAEQAETLATSRQRYADLQKYYAQLSQAREAIARGQPGWTWRATDALTEAARQKPPQESFVELRSLAAHCLGSPDLRRSQVLETGWPCSNIAFSPNSQYVAATQVKGQPFCQVKIFNLNDRTLKHTLTRMTVSDNVTRLFALGTNGKFQAGFRGVTFHPNGDELAVGGRFGELYLWNLKAPNEPPRVITAFPSPAGKAIPIDCIKFTSEGSRLLAASSSGEVRWWDASASYALLGSLGETASGIELSPDSKSPLGYGFGASRRFQLEAGEVSTDTLPATSGRPSFFPDGRLIASPASDKLQILDTRQGQIWHEFRDADNPDVTYEGLAFPALPAGVVAVSGSDARVKLFDMSSGKSIVAEATASPPSAAAEISPNHRWIAIAGDTGVQLLEIRSDSLCQVPGISRGDVKDADFLADGTVAWIDTVFAKEQPDRVDRSFITRAVLRDPSNVRETLLESHDVTNTRFQFLPPSSQQSTLARHPAEKGAHLVVNDALGLSWTDSQGRAHFPQSWGPAYPETRLIEEAEATAAAERDLVDDPQASQGKAASLKNTPPGTTLHIPAGKFSAKGYVAIAVRLKVAPSGNQTPQLRIERRCRGLAPLVLTPAVTTADYSYVVVDVAKTASLSNKAIEIAIASQGASRMWVDHVVLLPLAGEATSLERTPLCTGPACFARDGKRVWAVVDEEQVLSWRCSDGALQSRWSNRGSRVVSGSAVLTCIAASEQWIAVGSVPGKILLFDVETAELARALTLGRQAVHSLTFSPSGELLVAVGADGRLVVFDPESTAASELETAGSLVTAATLSPDSCLLFAGTSQGSIRIWERAGDRWTTWSELTRAGLPVRSLKVSPDGTHLLVVRKGSPAVQVWDLARLTDEYRRRGLE